jgi:hypothetical protein
MKRAILSTILAWAACVVYITIDTLLNTPSNGGSPTFMLLQKVEPITMILVAIVVFPTCLLVAAVLPRLLPPASPLWRPGIATAIGALAGPFAMYLWSAGMARRLFMPSWLHSFAIALAVASALAGATFAFSYATFTRNSRKP